MVDEVACSYPGILPILRSLIGGDTDYFQAWLPRSSWGEACIVFPPLCPVFFLQCQLSLEICHESIKTRAGSQIISLGTYQFHLRQMLTYFIKPASVFRKAIRHILHLAAADHRFDKVIQRTWTVKRNPDQTYATLHSYQEPWIITTECDLDQMVENLGSRSERVTRNTGNPAQESIASQQPPQPSTFFALFPTAGTIYGTSFYAKIVMLWHIQSVMLKALFPSARRIRRYGSSVVLAFGETSSKRDIMHNMNGNDE